MLESLCCVGVGLGPFQEQQKGKAPLVSLHCPQHTSCSCVSSQKWMCSDSAICGDFVCPQVPPLHCCVSDLLRGKTCH